MKHLDGSQSIRFRTSRSESDLQSVSPIDPSSGGNSGPDRRLTPDESSQRNAETLQIAGRYSKVTIATICTVFLLLPLTVIGLSARIDVNFGANTSRLNTAGKEEVKGASDSGPREGAALEEPPPPRLVAVGDFHGDFSKALGSLQLAGVVDSHGNWTGGATVLVQTGDVVDRGPHSVKLLSLLRRLKGQAEAAGGEVVTLLGNHELMNLEGQFGYVNPQELTQYGAARWALDFAPGGVLGAELAQQPALAVRGEGLCRTLFVHAGLTPAVGAMGLDAVNRMVREGVRGERGGGRSHMLGGHGPLWYRGYAEGSEMQICPKAKSVLKAMGAFRMVMGHTVQQNGIKARCGGSVVLIDIGISSAYKGTEGAWECVGPGKTRALYRESSKKLPAGLGLDID